MTKDLGVWTADDCALVLIDYQHLPAKRCRQRTRVTGRTHHQGGGRVIGRQIEGAF